MKDWGKGQWLLCVLLSLCLLIVNSPELSETASGVSVCVSVSHNYQDDFLLSIPLGIVDDLNLTKCDQSNRETSTTPEKLGTSSIFRCFTPNFHPTRRYFSHLDNIYISKFQQACQLIDIPPPSHLVS
jgi:hypothetical protein